MAIVKRLLTKVREFTDAHRSESVTGVSSVKPLNRPRVKTRAASRLAQSRATERKSDYSISNSILSSDAKHMLNSTRCERDNIDYSVFKESLNKLNHFKG